EKQRREAPFLCDCCFDCCLDLGEGCPRQTKKVLGFAGEGGRSVNVKRDTPRRRRFARPTHEAQQPAHAGQALMLDKTQSRGRSAGVPGATSATHADRNASQPGYPTV